MKKLGGFLRKEGYVFVKLRMLKSGHYRIKGSINGVKAAFILDTGASATVIDTNQVEKFGLGEIVKSEDEAAGLGGIAMDKFEIKDIKVGLGGFETETMQLNLVDLSHVNTAFKGFKMRPVDGIIGADILKTYNAVIDYKVDKLYLKNSI